MQTQYRPYAPPQVAQRSPHAANQRRGGIGPMMATGPHPSVPMNQAQIAQQHQAQAHATELARRRARQPTDKNLPEGVEDCVIEGQDAVSRYKELREAERRLDGIVVRKRMDVMDAVNGASRNKVTRTMRVWISNTVEDQAWQGGGLNVDAFDFTPNTEASFRVKIEGKLLDDEFDEAAGGNDTDNKMDEDDGTDKAKPAVVAPKPRFSHFFKSMTVEFDRSRSQDGSDSTVEWKKPELTARQQQQGAQLPGADFDEITFKRNGDDNQNIEIQLWRQENPERFLLSDELAEVVDMKEGTQQEVVMMLWEYIRMMGLQEDEEKRNFRCDELLRKVIKRGDVGYIPMLTEYVTQHLRPLPPIVLPYTVRVDQAFHSTSPPAATVYDIPVSVEDPLRATLLPLINNPSYGSTLKEVAQLDEQLARLVQAVGLSKAKHGFFDSLAKDPTSFIRNWLSSQKRDLEVIMGETARGGGVEGNVVSGDEWRKGGKDSAWGTENARESVNVLLSKQR